MLYDSVYINYPEEASLEKAGCDNGCTYIHEYTKGHGKSVKATVCEFYLNKAVIC